jgi:hypothetical protein
MPDSYCCPRSWTRFSPNTKVTTGLGSMRRGTPLEKLPSTALPANTHLFQASPNFVLETEALKESMLNVGKSVTVEFLQDCSGVDVLEVSRRGARRIPPASSNGEELRDVIHWLAILSYAKQNDARNCLSAGTVGLGEGRRCERGDPPGCERRRSPHRALQRHRRPPEAKLLILKTFGHLWRC